MTLRDRINAMDFDTSTPNDIAILLEQVFMDHDDRCRDGGPLIVAQGVIKRFEESVRRRAAPELHAQVRMKCAELRTTLVTLDTSLRSLEKNNAQTRT